MSEMESRKEFEAIAELTLEIRNLAHRGWEDRPNAEYLFREIGKRAQQIAESCQASRAAMEEKLVEFEGYIRSAEFVRNALGLRKALSEWNEQPPLLTATDVVMGLVVKLESLRPDGEVNASYR